MDFSKDRHNVVLQSLLILSTSFYVLIQKDSALFEKVEIFADNFLLG